MSTSFNARVCTSLQVRFWTAALASGGRYALGVVGRVWSVECRLAAVVEPVIRQVGIQGLQRRNFIVNITVDSRRFRHAKDWKGRFQRLEWKVTSRAAANCCLLCTGVNGTRISGREQFADRSCPHIFHRAMRCFTGPCVCSADRQPPFGPRLLHRDKLLDPVNGMAWAALFPPMVCRFAGRLVPHVAAQTEAIGQVGGRGVHRVHPKKNNIAHEEFARMPLTAEFLDDFHRIFCEPAVYAVRDPRPCARMYHGCGQNWVGYEILCKPRACPGRPSYPPRESRPCGDWMNHGPCTQSHSARRCTARCQRHAATCIRRSTQVH